MKTDIARLRIARDLKEAEFALNAAMEKQASLLDTMLSARRETGSNPFLGHEALLRLGKSQQLLMTSGGELARVHGQLVDVLEALEAQGNGPDLARMGFEKCPDDETGLAESSTQVA